MTVFIDASAMVAIAAFEPERAALIDHIEADGQPIWSAMACWEAVSAMRHAYGYDVDEARELIGAIAATLGIGMVSIAARELDFALDAYQRYGKGRHPAALNFGDCFAYACARANDAQLLYKGDDFVHTDLG